MGEDKKMIGPMNELAENFKRVESVGYALWTFKSGDLDPDGVYLLLGDYEYIFSYLLEQYVLHMIIELNPSLENEFMIDYKKIGSEGYYFIEGIDPKTFKNNNKHDKNGWIELNLELHEAAAKFLNQRQLSANRRIIETKKLLKK